MKSEVKVVEIDGEEMLVRETTIEPETIREVEDWRVKGVFKELDQVTVQLENFLAQWKRDVKDLKSLTQEQSNFSSFNERLSWAVNHHVWASANLGFHSIQARAARVKDDSAWVAGPAAEGE